jgi:hypothetical protein
MAYSTLKQAVEQQLADIRAAGLYKTERTILSPQHTEIRVTQGEVINLCANNYLGLANHPDVKQAAIDGIKTYGYGMASVRFICGTHQTHKTLEQATSRFFGTTVAWLFIVMGGHLLVIAALVQSFSAFPVGPEPFAFLRQMQPHRWGAEIFSTGLWIALPLVTMLLFVNLVLGAISRVAPQINIFAIGFPVTLSVGLLGLVFTLPAMQTPFVMALDRLLDNFR